MASMQQALLWPQASGGGRRQWQAPQATPNILNPSAGPNIQADISQPQNNIMSMLTPDRSTVGAGIGGMVGSLAGIPGLSGVGEYAAGGGAGPSIGRGVGSLLGSTFGPVGTLFGGWVGDKIGGAVSPATKSRKSRNRNSGGGGSRGGLSESQAHGNDFGGGSFGGSSYA